MFRLIFCQGVFFQMGWCNTTSTWRIIPVSKWLVSMVSKSAEWGCSPSKGPFMAKTIRMSNHLLTGMNLQVGALHPKGIFPPFFPTKNDGILPSKIPQVDGTNWDHPPRISRHVKGGWFSYPFPDSSRWGFNPRMMNLTSPATCLG